MIGLKKMAIVALLAVLTGCASLKYPNWDKVSVENSVINKPCMKAGVQESCSDSKADCETWFKKRATIVKANTTVIHSKATINEFSGKYYRCEPGLPLFTNFNIGDYKIGSNTIRGQAFLRQKGGGIVTCAGEPIYMQPSNEAYDEQFIENLLTNEEKALSKEAICDAQGNFEFHKVPSGKWIIKVNVSWDVFSVESVPLPSGNFYYTSDNKQGGILTKEVIVKEGEENKFIISQ